MFLPNELLLSYLSSVGVRVGGCVKFGVDLLNPTLPYGEFIGTIGDMGEWGDIGWR